MMRQSPLPIGGASGDVWHLIYSTWHSSCELPVLPQWWFPCPWVELHRQPILSWCWALEQLCVVPGGLASPSWCRRHITGTPFEDSTATEWPMEEMLPSVVGSLVWKLTHSAFWLEGLSLQHWFPFEPSQACLNLYQPSPGCHAPDYFDPALDTTMVLTILT